MKVAHPISDQLIRTLKATPGTAMSIASLLDLGPRQRVEKSLSRLVQEGTIKRIGRGLYEWPRASTIVPGPAQHSPDELVRAWARKNGLRVVPSGAYAANVLGLSTQVPAKLVYYTNGRTKTINLGPYTVRLLNRGPKTMDVGGEFLPLLLQALRFLGKRGVTPETIVRLRAILTPEGRREIPPNLRFASAWVKPVLAQIAQKEGDNG
jgi:hypothetical protein